MRALLVLTVLALAMFWVFDTYELHGRYTHSMTQQAKFETQKLTQTAKGWLSGAF